MDKPTEKPAKRAAKPRSDIKPRSAAAERVRRHREKMKAMGLKPVTQWLPDVNSPEFKAQVAESIRIINASEEEKAILEELSHIEIG